MKKIMMAAVAATFMSTGAQAESFSESCGHLDNPTRFNPTELSAYQECWLDYHKPNEMAGVLGSIFYARAGDNIVSMPVADLRNAGSAGAAKEIIVERIVEVINNERVEELEGIVEGLEATVSEKNAVIAALEAAGVTDGATIERLMMEKAAVEGALSALRGSVDGAGTSEIRVTRNGDMVAVDFVNRAAIAAEGDDTAYRNGQLSVGAQGVTQDGRTIRVRLTNRSETWTFYDAVDLTIDNQAAIDAARQGIIDAARVGYVTEAMRDADVSAVQATDISVARDGTITYTLSNSNIVYVPTATANSYDAGHADGIIAGRVGYLSQMDSDALVNAVAVTSITVSRDGSIAYALSNGNTVFTAMPTLNSYNAGVASVSRSDILAAARMAVVFPTTVDVSALQTITIPPALETGFNYDSSLSTGDNVGTLTRQGNQQSAWITYPVGDGRSNYQLVSDITNIGVQAHLDDIVEKIYDAGYNDGYDDGYADGYSDGFRDGVRAVQ